MGRPNHRNRPQGNLQSKRGRAKGLDSVQNNEFDDRASDKFADFRPFVLLSGYARHPLHRLGRSFVSRWLVGLSGLTDNIFEAQHEVRSSAVAGSGQSGRPT